MWNVEVYYFTDEGKAHVKFGDDYDSACWFAWELITHQVDSRPLICHNLDCLPINPKKFMRGTFGEQ